MSPEVSECSLEEVDELAQNTGEMPPTALCLAR